MAYYMEYSTRIYSIYLKYIAPEDIIVYSIDEVFMDVSDYLSTYKLTPRELAMKIILDVIENTGITATAGIGNIVAGRVISESEAMTREGEFEQMDLFTDYAAVEARRKQEQAELDRERKMQEVMLTIKNKYGKNAILKGMNLEEGATAKDRNEQIGGHRA